LLGCAALVLGAFGCATSDNPRDGGFFDGIDGLATGKYKKRIAEREERYQVEQEEQRRLNSEAEALKQERARVSAELNDATSRLASLEETLDKERERLLREQQSAELAYDKLRQLDELEARLIKVKSQIKGVSPMDGPLADLRAQSDLINGELDDIGAIIDVVAASSF
jgi:chromosome segregation ATPase